MRLKHEGSIYQRKDLYWCASVFINGKRRTKTFPKDGQSLALAALEEMKAEAKLTNGNGRQLFAHYLAEYITQTVRKQVRENSYMDYISITKTHINEALGAVPLCDITTKMLQAFYDGMARKGLSGSRINKAHTLIGQALRAALPDGLISRDPTVGTRRPSTKPRKEKLLFTDEQIEKFLFVADKSTSCYKDLLYLYWEVGGRISEVIGLKWQHVGSDHINIQSVRVRLKKGSIDSEPKTKASKRKVFLSDYAMNLIQKQPRNADHVFLNGNGNPIDERNWRRQWDQWLITAFGVDPIKSTYVENTKGEKKIKYRVPAVHVTPHALRHLQARNLIRQGWAVADVQKRGGWDSTKVLQEIYAAHSEEERQKEMATAASNYRAKKDDLLQNQLQNAEKPSD